VQTVRIYWQKMGISLNWLTFIPLSCSFGKCILHERTFCTPMSHRAGPIHRRRNSCSHATHDTTAIRAVRAGIAEGFLIFSYHRCLWSILW
jgi:hypothetical protein